MRLTRRRFSRQWIGALAACVAAVFTGCLQGRAPAPGGNQIPGVVPSRGEWTTVDSEVVERLKRRVTFRAKSEELISIALRLSKAAGVNVIASIELHDSPTPASEPPETVPIPSHYQLYCRSITIEAENQALYEILDQICQQGRLRWVYPDPEAPEEKRHGFIYLRPGPEEDSAVSN